MRFVLGDDCLDLTRVVLLLLLQLLLVVPTSQRINGDTIDIIERALHGELDGDREEFREETDMTIPDVIAPPPDHSDIIILSVPETLNWDLEDNNGTLPEAEKVDEWGEEISLPASHHHNIEQMIQDSEAISLFGSEARRELEEELVEAAVDLENFKPAMDGNSIDDTIVNLGRVEARIILEEIQIFNTDDFDGVESDVDGESPLIPR